jgi:VanZ family protein
MRRSQGKGVFISLLVVVYIICFIWWQSMQGGMASHAESRYVVEVVMSYARGTIIAPYVNDVIIRRLAHLTEYAILGGALSKFFLLKSGKSQEKWVLLLGFSIAAFDEYIQQFSGGRTSTWHDVGLDTIGCVVGVVIIVVARIIKRYCT